MSPAREDLGSGGAGGILEQTQLSLQDPTKVVFSKDFQSSLVTGQEENDI